jgi:putative hydrolase of the HAD superfamily
MFLANWIANLHICIKNTSMKANKYLSPQIENIIFDLGGVIINIDYQKTIDAFIELGIKNFHNIFSQASQNKTFDKLDIGELSNTDFYTKIKILFPKPISEQEIENAWNAMLLDIPPRRIALLKKLKKKHKLFLLSNTNAIHFPVFQKQLKKQEGLLLEDLFDKTYYSHKIGMRKPDKEVFQLILNENNILAEKTLFIDDSEQHILGAKKLGIKILHLKNDDICNLL